MNSHASPVLINHVHYPEIPGLAACLPCKSYGELTSPYPELPATVTALVASSAALLNKHSWGQSPWDGTLLLLRFLCLQGRQVAEAHRLVSTISGSHTWQCHLSPVTCILTYGRCEKKESGSLLAFWVFFFFQKPQFWPSILAHFHNLSPYSSLTLQAEAEGYQFKTSLISRVRPLSQH